MKIILKIQRFNPETDSEPYFKDYEVEADPNDRVLDSLMYVKTFVDGTLALRKSCAHGICGSDAMVINDVERLACKTLVKDVTDGDSAVIKIEPLKNMKLERDLMINYDEFFKHYRSVKPFLINENPPDEKERGQSPEEREKFDDATKCILCAACYSSCPVIHDVNPMFIGPAAVVQAARFVFDSRDRGLGERLDVLDKPDGVWACENKFNCTRVCPRGIKVTKNINFTKNRIKALKDESK